MANVLIIDDNQGLCRTLGRKLERMGDYRFEQAHTLAEGMEKAQAGSFDVVFLDVMMPDGNGLEMIDHVRAVESSPEVIIITAKGAGEGAALAINRGAWDYVQKGASLQTLILPLTRALQYRQESKKFAKARNLKREGIIGESQAINQCLDLVAHAAERDAHILIQGETGVGKELFARAIHENSKREKAGFIVLDCAALPKNLLASTLFGHEKGAFTGADRKNDGLLRQADGGTLFMDEVGELSPELQKVFLRTLQEKTFRPVGGDKDRKSDFRVIAATNRDLEQEVAEGNFRKDLLYRLNTISITVPALRERPEDIKDLVAYYVPRLCARDGVAVKGYSPDFIEALMEHDWPGNVRELIHTLERAIAMAGPEGALYAQLLPIELRIKSASSSLKPQKKEETAGMENQDASKPPSLSLPPPGPGPEQDSFPTYEQYRADGLALIVSQYLQELLRFTEGEITRAAQVSGLSVSRIYKLIKQNNIDLDDYRRD